MQISGSVPRDFDFFMVEDRDWKLNFIFSKFVSPGDYYASQVTSGPNLKSSVPEEPGHSPEISNRPAEAQAGFWKQTGTGCQGTSLAFPSLMNRIWGLQ